ncbi:bifunctional 4-hydroxy-2-oxoglutarate aldolase/2-dehydro-3-deoxy-phosphogluconate aldolase [Candidatus Laterigemmans baculatus]|nr:bifunctional 4-hydroxy-2-oxoglutarate aldolase/2-dehydro-3-deoxy-phosphogluconate aldolase [Candidatus Laterigemmans baculatus]
MQDRFDWDRFQRLPLVGILRGFTAPQASQAARAAVDGGLTTIEVTLNTAEAAEQIERLQSELGNAANVGAGTVCSVEDVELAVRSGATFIVTPVVDAEVIAAGRSAGLPVFAGAMTPSESLAAWRAGATMVKVFPAEILGPAYIRAVRGPLSQIPLMPTGGVSVENLAEYHRAGAVAFGIGGPLFDKQRVMAADWSWIAAQARRFAEAWEESLATLGDAAPAMKV